MSKVAILGAGAMGSALATPYRKAGHDVALWGTWLDDHLLDACEAGKPHPRTNEMLADGTATFRSGELAQALEGADIIVLAVSSEGVVDVVARAIDASAQAMTGAKAFALTSKGFSADDDGNVRLLPDAIRDVARDKDITMPSLVPIGGPCKANEVAADLPTATVYASTDPAAAQYLAEALSTDTYRIEAGQDEVGLEVSAPMKNVYAIALGLADGLHEAIGKPHHNLKSAIFAQAVAEMGMLADRLGGQRSTVYGLAGVGDLEVTGLSGRNKVYGVRIGKGEVATQALKAMAEAELTVEGVPATRLARQLVDQLGGPLVEQMRLLSAIHNILDDAADPAALVAAASLPNAG